MLGKIRNLLVHLKVYFSRSLSYVSILNMALILFIALSSLEKYGIDMVLGRWIIPLFLLLIIMLLFLGYLEDRAGFFTEEQRMQASRNPQLNDVIKRLERIEKKVDKNGR